MKKILILAEFKGSKIKSSTLEILPFIKGQDISAVILGSTASAAAEDLAAHGVKKVYVVEDATLDNYQPELAGSAISAAIDLVKPDFVISAATSFGKDLLPRLAARYDAGLAADVTSLSVEPFSARRGFYSGKAEATITFEGESKIFVSLRPNSGKPAEVSPEKGVVEKLAVTLAAGSGRLKSLGKTAAKSDRPDLTEAQVVVSGGRSLQKAENFKILQDMADVLGGAVGASRAAVDEGLAPHDAQVGQTGKVVNPGLYIACGISGAIQHLAGMRSSKVIVAINKDKEAPIFKKADYGIVGDLFEVVPLATEELKKLLGKA